MIFLLKNQIAESGSFSLAAKKLFVSQPSLNFSLNSLEKELGFKLFNRSNKGVTLTEYGEIVYSDAIDILKMLTDKQEKWSALNNKQIPSGTVNVTIMPIISDFFIENIMYKIPLTYPELKINLSTSHIYKIIDNLVKGNCNIAIVNLFDEDDSFFKLLEDKNFIFHPLMEDEYCVALSKNNELSQKPFIDVKDLVDQNIATYSLSNNKKHLLWLNILQYLDPNKFYFLESKDNILRFVVDNKAVTFFLKNMLKNNLYVRNGYIKCLPIKNVNIKTTHYIVYSHECLSSLNESAMIEYIINQYVNSL